jgi:hypothetical protein
MPVAGGDKGTTFFEQACIELVEIRGFCLLGGKKWLK